MRIPAITAILTAALGSSACYVTVDDTRPHARTGDLTLRYSFDGRDCIAAGVDRIAIDVRGIVSRDRYTDTLSCSSFVDGVTIENLIEDEYEVTIEGRTFSGDLLYSLDRRTIGVVAYTHQEYDFDLFGSTGSLTVYWTFDGYGDCGMVDDVRVRLIDPEGFVYDDARYNCEYGGIVYDVLSSGRWRITLEGMSFGGRVLYRMADHDIEVIPSASNEYTIDLGAQM